MSLPPLFVNPDKELQKIHRDVFDAIHRIAPIPRNHRRDLPYAIRDLSRLLTQERGSLAKPYWVAPRFLAAYLYYFLPWNILRLAWLLPQLPFDFPQKGTILDLGSGPLTLPLALWCSRKDLRNHELTFICSDTAQKPLDAGNKILTQLMGEKTPWRIQLTRAPMHIALKKCNSPVDAIIAGNVLNEITAPRHTPLEKTIGSLAAMMQQALTPTGQLLIVEPGTRLGGKMIALGRAGALEAGMKALAPCLHNNPCPMAPEPQNSRPDYSGWCHFTYPAQGAPIELLSLGQEAKLSRQSIALSFVLMQNTPSQDKQGATHKKTANNAHHARNAEAHSTRPQHATRTPHNTNETFESLDDLDLLFAEMMGADENMAPTPAKPLNYTPPHMQPPKKTAPLPIAFDVPFSVQVISAPIDLPHEPEPARYGCCQYGLALIRNAQSFYPGTTITVQADSTQKELGEKQAMYDLKTQALMVHVPKNIPS